MIDNIKQVKIQTLEEKFGEKTKKMKEKEKRKLIDMGVCSAAIYAVMGSPGLIFFFFFMTWSNLQLSNGEVFCLITMLQMIKSAMDDASSLVVVLKSSSISLERIGEFLIERGKGGRSSLSLIGTTDVSQMNEGEGDKLTRQDIEERKNNYLDHSLENHLRLSSQGQDRQNQLFLGCLSLRNCSFSWIGSRSSNAANDFEEKIGSDKEFLKDVWIEFAKGRLVGITGDLGSGKTALLEALKNRMKLLGGEIRIVGKITSIYQEPLLINDTVRNNILFSNEYDRAKYRRILKVCRLNEDISTMAGGDMTEIGDNAANLSEGQRHRICIARALYEDGDIYLIDDCLNALDNDIASSILKEAFEGFLGEKTRLIVTNNTKILDRFDEIIVMKEGQIAFQGSYTDLCRIYPDFRENQELDQKRNPLKVSTEDEKKERKGSNMDHSFEKNQTKERGKLTIEETQHEGTLDPKVLMFFIRNGGTVLFFSLMILFFLGTAVLMIIDGISGDWAKYKREEKIDENQKKQKLGAYALVFICSTAIGVAINFIKVTGLKRFMTQSTFNIFNSITWKFLRRPLSFFHQTQSGVIVNRCTDDIEIVDYEMQLEFHLLIDSVMQVIGSWMLAIFTIPPFAILVALNMIVMYFIIAGYLKTAVDLKRLYRITRSRVLGSVMEYVKLVKLYKNSKISQSLFSKWVKFHNESINVAVHEAWIRGWIEITLGSALSFVFIILVLICFCLKIYWGGKSIDSASQVKWGLILTYTYLNIEKVGIFVYNSGLLVTNMSVVERLKEYAEVKDLERSCLEDQIEKTWPQTGDLSFDQVSIRYRKKLRYVLDELSFEVKDGEKVAIIGRTGGGKSTIFQSIMRLLEIEDDDQYSSRSSSPLERSISNRVDGSDISRDINENGEIRISGVDIASVSLPRLRSSIGMITQEPILLGETVREVVDPWDEFSDLEIINQLERFGDFFISSVMNNQKITKIDEKEKYEE